MKIIRLRHGARLVDGDDVLSEIRSSPGPTDSFFDILAASAVALTPGPRVLLLGFAGGGIIAPLRAMGYAGRLQAVDQSRDGRSLFHELCGAWAGPIDFHQAEATAWLRRRRSRFDLILEDLSVPGPECLTKPEVSVHTLPRLMQARLSAAGVAVTNLLPVPGLTWKELEARLSAPWRRCLVLQADEYENRLLIGGSTLGSAARTSRRLRDTLRAIGSLEAERIAVRTLA